MRSIAASAGYESVRGVATRWPTPSRSMALDERANANCTCPAPSHLAHSRSLADLAPLFDALEEQVSADEAQEQPGEETIASGVGVAIGSEMHTPGLLRASVVSGGYGRSGAAGEPAGERSRRRAETESETEARRTTRNPSPSFGSIGPTHMDYAATMAAVQGRSQIFDRLPLRGRTQD